MDGYAPEGNAMNKTSTIRMALLALGFPLLTTLCTALGFLLGVRTGIPSDLRLFQDIRSLVVEGYVEPRGPEELLFAGLEGMLSSLDRHSAFFPPREAREVEERTQGRYEGIGVLLAPPREHLTILFPMAGSPAEAAGLLPGDRIVAAEGMELAELTEAERLERIRGPAGTRVRLLVEREGAERFEVEVERAAVKTSSVCKSRLLDAQEGIGYLALSEFQAHTVQDVDEAWEELGRKGARSLILDLRFNGGGNLEQASLLANRFLPGRGSPLVKVLGRVRHYSHDYEARPEEAHLEQVPLVVLVDGSSASSSEIFAAVIQDWCRGVVVGAQTFGKGTVQTLATLRRNQEVKVKFTIARYATSSGLLVEPTEAERQGGAKGGVLPDFPVALPLGSVQGLHSWLLSRDPPARYAEQVERLRDRLGAPAPRMPADPQLDQALDLLRGRPSLLAAGQPGGGGQDGPAPREGRR